MATKLRHLKITKVDLCPAGADPDADIVIFKSRDFVEKRDIPTSHRHKMPSGSFAGPHESFPIEKPEDAKNAWDLAGHAKNPDAVRARIKSIARRKGAAFVAALPDSAKAVSKEDVNVPKFKKIDVTKATDEEVAAYVGDLEKALEDQDAELAKAASKGKSKKPAPSDNDADDLEKDDEVMCSRDSKVQKAIDDANARVAQAERVAKEADDRAKKAEERISKAEEKAELAELAKSVERDMPKVPGTVAEVAKMMFEAKRSMTAESYTILEKALKGGSEAIAKASEEIGSNRGVAMGTAEARLMAKADEIAKERKVTQSEAVNIVAKDHPDLYNDYRKERGLGPKTR